MIEIYSHENTNFLSNGDITLTQTEVSGKIVLNGECFLKVVHPYDKLGRWTYILNDNIIACPTPWGAKQLFRIYNVVKDIEDVTAYARPVYFDLINYTLLNTTLTNATGQVALNAILNDTPFTGHSNITGTKSTNYNLKNVIESIAADDENSFLNLWGGEIFYNNYDITINQKIGVDNNVRIDFGYNLKEIEENINIDNVVTRIIPVGYNDLMLDGATPWVDSANVNKFANIKTKVLTFDDVKVKEDPNDTEGFNTIAEARAELINRCNAAFSDGLDSPTATYNINIALLKNTTAYKNFQVLEDIKLGDTVHCHYSKLDIDISTRCVEIEWEILSENNKVVPTNIILGTVEKNYFDNSSDVQNRVKKVLNNNGSLNGGDIEGIINAVKARFKALKDVAQTQHIRAMLFEDRDENSLTFGAMCIGTMGFEISSELVNGEWNWTTFGTGQGFSANYINVGILTAILIQSQTGGTFLNLNNGTFQLGASDGSSVATHTATGSIWRHSSGENSSVNATGFYKNGRPYHTLMTAGYCITGGSGGTYPATATIQLGDEWKNTNFTVLASTVDTQGGITLEYMKRIQLEVSNINLTNATFQITGSWTSIYNGSENNKELRSMYIVIGG